MQTISTRINKPNPNNPKLAESVSHAKLNLLGMSLLQLQNYFTSIGEKSFRALQVFKWIHQYGYTDFSSMSNLSINFRNYLENNCEVLAPKIHQEQLSQDGTRKWLFAVPGGSLVETVFIPEKNRGTLCISSQVGCALDCKFCSTGKQGFNRNLTSAEIIGQLFMVKQRLKDTYQQSSTWHQEVTNVVMMGMGEPLLNYDNVKHAISIMREDNAYGLAKRRVTVSTSGVVPAIYKLADEVDASLALSLHAPDNDLRTQIMPINNKYPIEELLAACKYFANKHNRLKITIEYVMLEGINDSVMHAKQLAKLLQGTPCKLNLIPFNPFDNSGFSTPSKSRINDFSRVMQNSGYITTTRTTRGDDIDAACGQLAGEVIDITKRSLRYKQQSNIKSNTNREFNDNALPS